MKTLVSLCISVLAAVTLLSILPVHGEESVYENVVRLHVIAASDSDEDQALKLKVRDAVLECVRARLAEVEDHAAAFAVLDGMREQIRTAAEEVLLREGDCSCVTVELGDEQYPARHYEGFTLPAGVYASLRVTIGEGDGQNWWCILFPSVCITDAIEAREDYVEAGFTPEQYRVIEEGSGGRYRVRFRVLEILSGLLGFRY